MIYSNLEEPFSYDLLYLFTTFYNFVEQIEFAILGRFIITTGMENGIFPREGKTGEEIENVAYPSAGSIIVVQTAVATGGSS